jgi:class 3 adenylate cyclase
MNTAARMESNSARNRIHVSEATANLLIKAGKSSWVTQRQDKIVAKGKGEMQTYWVKKGPSRRAPESTPPDAAINVKRNQEIHSPICILEKSTEY